MWKYLFKKYWNIVMFLFFSVFTYTFLSLVFYMYSLITQTTTNADMAMARIVALVCMLIIIGLFVFLIILSFFKRLILANTSRLLRNDIMKKVFSVTLTKYFTKNTSYYSSMLLNDVEAVETEYFANVLELFGDTIQLLIMVGFIALMGWEFLIIVLLFSLPSILQPFALRGRLGSMGLKVSENYEKYTDKVKECIDSFEIAKMFGKTDVFGAKFSDSVNSLERKRKNEYMLKALNTGMVMITVYFLKAGTQLYFINSALNGAITVAAVTLLFGFANNVGNPIASILSYFSAINSTKEVRSKITAFLKLNDVTDKAKEPLRFDDEISMENVTFTYEGSSTPILNNISVKFQKGKKYLLVGRSGSGKSTILRFLMGYYHNYKGKIQFDKIDMHSLGQKSLWQTMTIIHQNVFIFSGSIKDNITLYDGKYTDEQVLDAIKKSGLADLVGLLPNGIYTEISEGGSNFSGGEKQRLSIARALLANKEIILVDEGTSALDNVTAFEIENMLLASEKTVISISHKLGGNIREYDAIAVLENGRISAFGKYDELIETSEFLISYANNNESQL